MKKWLAKFFLKKALTRANLFEIVRRMVSAAIAKVSVTGATGAKAKLTLEYTRKIADILTRIIDAGEDGEVTVEEISELLSAIETEFNVSLTDDALAKMIDALVEKM